MFCSLLKKGRVIPLMIFFLQDEMTDRPPSYPGCEDTTLSPPMVTIAASRTSEATCGSGKELDQQQDEHEVVVRVSLIMEFNLTRLLSG